MTSTLSAGQLFGCFFNFNLPISVAATGYRGQSVRGTTVHQYSMRTSMVRYLHGREESFPLVAHMGVLKLTQLEMY